ncbi:MAG: hypothetical protein GC191_05900 [Azospirillum sp.]|nr:hypothetical protein [Azospirillum sp.]
MSNQRRDNQRRKVQAEVLAILRTLGLAPEARNLEGADRLLDDVRRVSWFVAFAAGSFETAAEALGTTSPTVLQIARSFEGKRLTEINELIEEARLGLWMSTYGNIPDSNFARIAHGQTEPTEIASPRDRIVNLDDWRPRGKPS